MPDRIYAYENSKIQLIFNATDPEGYPMHYSYNSSTMRNISLDETQEPVLLNVFVTKSGALTLKVTEVRVSEKLKAYHTIEFVAVPRVCQTSK